MMWLYGIPDVSLANHFVYFNSLMDASPNNTYSGYIRKYEVGSTAQELFNSEMSRISKAEAEIKQAVDFISKIAISERKKELAVARAYIKQMEKQIPTIKDSIDESTIINNPEKFYTQLTSLINKYKMDVNKYTKELERIKANANGAKEKLSDYFKDDYRYRLNTDITSMLRKIIGTYREDKDTINTYNQQIQEMALEIINEMVGSKKIETEDFAALAAAVLTEIEMRAQALVDSEGLKDFTELVKEDLLRPLKTEYLNELKKTTNEKESAVQKALKDINSEEFLRITRNVKKILGISSLDTTSSEYKKQLEDIKTKAQQRSKNTKDARKAVSNVQKLLGTRAKSMHTITFKKLQSNSAHGDMNELIATLIEKNGIKAGETAATDILSISCNWDIKPDDKFINDILSEIGEEMGKVIDLDDKEKANEKDLREAIDRMNKKIDEAIKKLEEKGNQLNKNNTEDFFIFHESLKLYSSIETGVYKKWGGHNGFGGREMNILSYIDFMLSAADEAGISTPANRDLLIFLALNLSASAVGKGNSSPLAKYFSIFAGLLMFDDVVNMAKEALNNIPESSVKQIHLYNLNGIYVPASMVLSYVSDALQLGAQEASYAATASINSSAATKAIDKWTIKWSEKNFHPILGPKDWNEMGSAVASGTKVKIAFMSAFLDFVNKLSNL